VTSDENYEVYTLTLPPGCCVAQDAFLLLSFTGFNTCSNPTNGFTTGLTATTSACVNCEEFFTTGYSIPDLSDWCSSSEGTSNSLWIQLEADCCAATPTVPHSWGRIKTVYR
jgi:hypothetical protein